LLKQYEDFLPTLFGVSEVELNVGAGLQSRPPVEVQRATGTKCERCWRYLPALNTEGLCPRCVEALGR
jgi:isoleucyl-tRNA synthetase